jgi:PAS domain S-box-containing protein
MHFFSRLFNINPPVPEIEDLSTLRENILTQLLRALAIFCAITTVVAVYSAVQKGLWFPALIFALMYVWLLVITFVPRIAYWVRVSSLLALEYIGGLTGLLSSGLSGDGRSFLFALVVSAVVLLGTHRGIFTLLLSMITFLIVGSGMSNGWITLPPEAVLLNSGNAIDWVTGTLVFFLLGFVCLNMISYILSGLSKVIEQQNFLSAQLRQEQQNLKEGVRETTQELIEEKTERKAAQESLSRVRSLLEIAIEQSGSGMMIADAPDIILRHHNAAAAAILGLRPDEDVLNLPLAQAHTSWQFHDQNGEPLQLQDRPIYRVVIGGEVLRNERMRVVRADGSQRWILINGSPVHDENGEVVAGVILFSDISHAHRAEQALQQSEERYRRLVELSPDAIAVHQQGKIVFVNPAALHLMGASSPEELIGRPIQAVVAPEYQKMVADRIRAAMQTGEPLPLMEEEFVRLDGSHVAVEVASSPCSFNGQPALQVFVRDITGRKETEIELRQSRQELEEAYEATLVGWARALELRERQTAGHSQRVVEMTVHLARRLGIEEEKIPHLRRGALLHDIGKMGIPDHILLKPAPLDEEEWIIMRQHPSYAVEMLSPIPYLSPALEIPHAHHEKWDGSGFPRNLKGEEIPLAARIFAVVDVWDALTSDRPYRSAWSEKDALEYIQQQIGQYFDPAVAEIFLREVVTQHREV